MDDLPYKVIPASGRSSGTRLVLYAVPGEEWRLDAYLLLRKTAERSGWNDGFERMEGTLLGYEDWQNDVWIEYRNSLLTDSAK